MAFFIMQYVSCEFIITMTTVNIVIVFFFFFQTIDVYDSLKVSFELGIEFFKIGICAGPNLNMRYHNNQELLVLAITTDINILYKR